MHGQHRCRHVQDAFGGNRSCLGAPKAAWEECLYSFPEGGMDALLVLVFANGIGAIAGAQALHALHAEGELTLYAMAIISRQSQGSGVIVRRPVAEGGSAAAPAVGAAVGTLISLLGGPATAATRTVPSALMRAMRDLDEQGLDAGFLEEVSTSLRPGGEAVIAEAEEDRQLILEPRIAALAGHVQRYHLMASLTEERLMQKIMTLRSDLAGLMTEWSSAKQVAAARAVRRSRVAELRTALKQAEALAAALRREGAAKVEVLRVQATQLEGRARIAVGHRAERVRARLEARAARLDRVAAARVIAGFGAVLPGDSLSQAR